jgi:GNAT superfamily N-acetyltransferase
VSALLIREFRVSDGPQVMEIQAAHAGAFPGAAVVPLEVYSHPAFGGGRNILCATDEYGRLSAYASLFPSPAPADAGVSNTFWAEIKAHPRNKERASARSRLLEAMLRRARELAAELPVERSRICLQYVRTETSSIAFAGENGFDTHSSIFTLDRDLIDHPPRESIPPRGITVRQSRMPMATERSDYLIARNSSLPYAAWSSDDLAHLLDSPLFERGAAFTGYDGETITGGVMAYWDIAELRRLDPAGCTEQVFVSPTYRGRGLATHLLETASRFLSSHGLRHARLEVLADNKQAIALYEKLGYKIVAEQLVYELYI